MVAREKAEAAYLAARGQPASVLVPLWEAWSAAQKACINNKPQLKGSAKEIPHPLGKQREGAGTNTTPKPGGQGCSPAALARMCYEVERGTKNWKMGAWKESRLMASLSHGRTWEENFKAGEKRIMDMRLNKTKTKACLAEGSDKTLCSCALLMSHVRAHNNDKVTNLLFSSRLFFPLVFRLSSLFSSLLFVTPREKLVQERRGNSSRTHNTLRHTSRALRRVA